MKSLLLVLIGVLAFITPNAISWSLFGPSQITLTIFYESLDKHSQKFFREQVFPTYYSLGDNIKLDLVPFGLGRRNQSSPLGFDCTNGLQDCLGDAFQACAAYHITDQNKLVDFIDCTFKVYNKHSDSLQTSTDSHYCAHIAGVDFEPIKNCVYWDTRKMLTENYNRTPSLDYVPTVHIDGSHANSRCMADLFECVCSTFSTAPSACNDRYTVKKYGNDEKY